ncbi:hypothetical protein [Asticcacaulis solisilvae]|uniref:hypothetical protein n=1 Tax=Asticcacaulis solisilvae TaxID=1217274 RepID=UPI003FD73002
MDAVTFLRGCKRHRVAVALFLIVCLQPSLNGIFGRLLRGQWWFSDFDAVLCGADNLARGHTPYELVPHCAGTDPATFVYLPQIAAVFEPLIRVFGMGGVRLLFTLILMPFVVALFGYGLGGRLRLPLPLRLLSWGAIRGSVLASGNVGLILNGAALMAGLMLKRARWPLLLVIAGAAMIKPMSVTYLVLFLLDRRPLRERLAFIALGGALSTAAFGALYLTGGEWMDAWRHTVGVVLTGQPGSGFIRLVQMIGLPASSWASALLYLMLAGSLCLAALILAEAGDLDDTGRMAVAMLLAQLLNPRLQDYDLYLLYPSIAYAVMACAEAAPARFRPLSWAFVAAMAVINLSNVCGVKIVDQVPVAWLLGLAALYTASFAMLKRRDAVAEASRIPAE